MRNCKNTPRPSIEVWIHARASHSRTYEEQLPEPMADPLQELRIKAATASAYFVKAGEFIQIIDVAGRQCTDFQAFAARKVDKGLDRALDATVTRTPARAQLSDAGASLQGI